MPTFFSKVFKGKDGRAASKSRKNAALADQSAVAVKTRAWEDAWAREEVSPTEVQELLRGCTVELKARALDMPFLLLPYRPTSDPSAARVFVRNYFNAAVEGGQEEMLQQELRLAEPMVLCSVMKWCWGRLPGGVVSWEAYELFRVGEQDSDFARDSFATFLPLSVDSDARTKIIFDFFDLLAAIAAHGKSNGLSGRKISRLAGWWAFEHTDKGVGFDEGYKSWASAADATSHLFFAYLRSLTPTTRKGISGISALPISLQTLVQQTEYPPETPTLMQTSTLKVIMSVDSVSPTPFALLRRAKNFEYRDDDAALQAFADFDDPVEALTEECRRVLRCISSTNQSEVVSSAVTTGVPDASWSRFEDIGFSSLLQEEDTNNRDTTSRNTASDGLRSAPSSRMQNSGRPATPSWADFLSSGFNDEATNKGPAPLLLPPDKVLPPIETTRAHSSQARSFMSDTDSQLEPGELASISRLDLDDSFWWVWITSLANEEPAERKAVFGRCALVETNIKGGRWLIIEEKVKGAAPLPVEGAYIAEKKRRFGFSKRSRSSRKTALNKSTLASSDEPYQNNRSTTASKSNLGSDQHARIRDAAAALQQKQRHPESEATAAETTRRGRLGEDAAAKTNSVFTLQPVIMNEAGPAMKWANRFDKDSIREAYLGNDSTGRGSEVTLNGNAKRPTAEPTATPRTSSRNRDLPAIPSTDAAKDPVNEPTKTVTPPPLPPTPSADATTQGVGNQEAVDVPLPTDGASPAVQDTSAEPESTEPNYDAGIESPDGGQKKKAASKKLQKRSAAGAGAGGFKKFFGRKHTEVGGTEPSHVTSADQPGPRDQQDDSPSRRFSSFRLKGNPKAGRAQDSTLPDTGRVDQAAETVTQADVPASGKAASITPATSLKDEIPSQSYQPSQPSVSRVDTNEERNADREFSTFDQGPLEDVPAFVPEDSPEPPEVPIAQTQREQGSAVAAVPADTPNTPSPLPNTAPASSVVSPQEQRQQEQQPMTPAATQPDTARDEAIKDNSDSTREAAPPTQDRWAQIRKNAAERAAATRVSEDQSSRPSQSARTDDGETSGEETIESRVARIKARVAELTGNMDEPNGVKATPR
ncbi:MAG: hypothetical protein M1825_000659 [Sarcosagium campestre]|nr:MAG: hypothetical protein M1825_000659 [Sarcosagium campestre]